MQAFILCGGLGTRLRSVIQDRPKPMALVAGKPFLEYLLCFFRRYGFNDIILSTGYRGEFFADYFGDGSAWQLKIRYSHETMPLGTGGALKLAEPLLRDEAVLVANGDSFFDADLTRLLAAHAHAGALATLALAQVADTERYGAVTIDDRGCITAFNEKAAAGPGVINGGIYLIHSFLLARIPAAQMVSLEREVFPSLIGDAFYGVPFNGYIVDIGTAESYRQICAAPEQLLTATGY